MALRLGHVAGVGWHKVRSGVNPATVAYCLAKTGTTVLEPYGNTHVGLDRCTVKGQGRLRVGLTRPGQRRLPSQLVAQRNSTIHVRGAFDIYSGCIVAVTKNAVLNLGSGCIDDGLYLSCFEVITIGDEVAIGPHVAIRDSDNHQLNGSVRSAPIHIADHVWVGMGSTILKGVTIGEGAVIAAGSVVNRVVPARALVAGVPAALKRTDVEWT